MKIDKSKLVDAIVRIACFVCFSAVAIYSYAQMDAWFYRNGLLWYRGLTIYHPQRFGEIHTPTLLLCMYVGLAWYFSAMARDVLNTAVGIGIRKWQYKEEVVFYGDSESA